MQDIAQLEKVQMQYTIIVYIIESVDSISRDAPDTPIYVIHYKKPKISEQTIVHVRTSCLKNSQLSFSLSLISFFRYRRSL